MVITFMFFFLLAGPLKAKLVGLDDTVTCIATFQNQAKKVVAAGCKEGEVMIWKMEDVLQTINFHKDAVKCIAISGKLQHLLTSSLDFFTCYQSTVIAQTLLRVCLKAQLFASIVE